MARESRQGDTFPRAYRLTRGVDLAAVRRAGKRLRLSADLDVRAVVSDRTHPRIGVIVPRYKHTAVDRNRLKRRLRELVRTRLITGLPPVDLVIRALPTAYAVPFDALAAQVDGVRRVCTEP